MPAFGNWLNRIKSSIFPINPQLLKLKFSYFFIYATWISMFPYLAILSTKIVSSEEVTLSYATVPLASILGPVVTGFLGDKLGNYKIILMCTMLLAGFIHLTIIWLPRQDLIPDVDASSVNQSINNVNDSRVNEETDDTLITPQVSYAFPILIAIRTVGFFAIDATNALQEACGMTITKQQGGDLGQQKMWSNFAFVIMPLIVGFLVDFISQYRGFKDYSVAFYITAACAVTFTIIISQLDVRVQSNKKSVLKTFKAVMGMIDVDIFLLVEIVVGLCWGWHLNFFGVYVDSELLGSKTLLGGSLSLSGIGGTFIICVAKPIIDRCGTANTICAVLMLYSTRFIIYYFLKTNWVILLIESFDGFCGFLGLIAGNFYTATAAPPGMLASLNGILFAAFSGIGRGLGTTVGGSIISTHGIRFTYLVFGILAGVTSVTYFVAYHLVLKDIERRRLSSAKDSTGTGMVNTGAELSDDLSRPKTSHQEVKPVSVEIVSSKEL